MSVPINITGAVFMKLIMLRKCTQQQKIYYNLLCPKIKMYITYYDSNINISLDSQMEIKTVNRPRTRSGYILEWSDSLDKFTRNRNIEYYVWWEVTAKSQAMSRAGQITED